MVVFDDVVLTALGAAAEDDRVGERAGVAEAGAVERGLDGGPGGEVGAVAGGLIADLAGQPAAVVFGEGDLAGAQDGVAAGAGDMLASLRGEAENAVHVDDEREWSVSLAGGLSGQPGGEIVVRGDRAAVTAGRHSVTDLGGPT